MKKFLIAILLLVNIISASAQEKKDSIEVRRDTINLRGFVYDKYDNPLQGVTVWSENASTKTLKNGYFELKGILNKSNLSFVKDSLSDIIFNNDSRFIIYHLVPLSTRKLTSYDNNLKIEAQRISPKLLINTKIKRNECEGCFITYETPASYPGGMDKFYIFIRNNLKYPEKAIINNIEGLVIIDFDIKKNGETGNFKIIRDIGFGCSEALINVIKKSKKWNPVLSNGKPISQRFSIEVPFKLID